MGDPITLIEHHMTFTREYPPGNYLPGIVLDYESIVPRLIVSAKRSLSRFEVDSTQIGMT